VCFICTHETNKSILRHVKSFDHHWTDWIMCFKDIFTGKPSGHLFEVSYHKIQYKQLISCFVKMFNLVKKRVWKENIAVIYVTFEAFIVNLLKSSWSNSYTTAVLKTIILWTCCVTSRYQYFGTQDGCVKLNRPHTASDLLYCYLTWRMIIPSFQVYQQDATLKDILYYCGTLKRTLRNTVGYFPEIQVLLLQFTFSSDVFLLKCCFLF
jgi:hypothetical protein